MTQTLLTKKAQPFPAPVKPEVPEANVLHAIAPGEIDSPEQILKRQLARRGMKYTGERALILQTVLSDHDHFDAETLYAKLRALGSNVSKATVYRTLHVLCECGLVREVFMGKRGSAYEHIYGHEHHEHMICNSCDKVTEFISHELEEIQHEACKAHGFHAVHHHLQIYGYCAECHPCKGFIPPKPQKKSLHELPTPESILRNQVARRGLKYTGEREFILKQVLSLHDHFDAERLYAHLKKAGARIGKATVYRTLALLCECGLVREVFHNQNGAYYEHTYGHDHHEHMICSACNKVIEFISRPIEQIQDQACRAHGFHAVRHNLQIFGYCSECHPCGANFPPDKKPE